MKTLEQHVAHFRSLSIILNPEKGNIYNGVYLSEDRNNLQSHYDQITSKHGWRDTAKEEVALIEKQFKFYQQDKINCGDKKPEVMPDSFLKRKFVWDAKLIVFGEELKEISEQMILCDKRLEEQDSKELPRKHWGTCKLRGGIVYRMAGWKVKPNKEHILAFSDKRSPFNGIPLHRFKSEVLTPLAKEESFRNRQAEKQAKKTGEPKVPITKVKTPVYDPETDEIFYPDFSKPWVELNKEKLNKKS